MLRDYIVSMGNNSEDRARYAKARKRIKDKNRDSVLWQRRRREAEAAAEEARAPEFDARVVNDDVDVAVTRVAGILASRTAGA